jgi:uncharacterized membrane protein
MLIMLLGAVAVNANLVPAQSPVYDVVRGPVTSFAIVWLLLAVDLKDALRIGPMLLAFVVAVAATVIGAVAGSMIFADAFPGEAWKLAGVLTGTYSGGGVNFVAVSREVGITGPLFVALAAADRLVTAAWLGATLLLPVWLRRLYPPPAVTRPEAEKREPESFDSLTFRLQDLLALGALAAVLMIVSERIAGAVPGIPAVLWLTTLALAAGQLRVVRSLRGSFQLGLVALNLFFAAGGMSSRVSEILEVGPEVAYLTLTVVAIHGVAVLVLGRLLRLDIEMLCVASQAAVGGAGTALAQATARGVRQYVLPGVLAGLLGYALGNYVGLAVAALLR